MNFTNIRNINSLLDSEYRSDRMANAVTDIYIKYLTDVANASKMLLGIHNNFINYYTTIVKPADSISSEAKKKIDFKISDYLSQYSDKLNTTIGGVQKVLDFIEPALKTKKFSPAIEKSVEDAGFTAEPDENEFDDTVIEPTMVVRE